MHLSVITQVLVNKHNVSFFPLAAHSTFNKVLMRASFQDTVLFEEGLMFNVIRPLECVT
jgi:hypothetical protein